MRSLSSEKIECPLCAGAGELSRAEILDRLGVRDFARVAQLSAEEAFRLLQQRYSNDHQNAWSRFESELTKRTAELKERFKDELHLAMTEKMSYAGMAVANGQCAGLAWESLVRGGSDCHECDRIRKGLLEYCRQDALALVKIVTMVRSISTGSV